MSARDTTTPIKFYQADRIGEMMLPLSKHAKKQTGIEPIDRITFLNSIYNESGVLNGLWETEEGEPYF